MKYSRQREAVYHAVADASLHPTADMVYEIVKKSNPQISLGTVYRNLNQLAENGQLLKISMPTGSDRFDGRLDEHYHMICVVCGRVLDIEGAALCRLDGDIKAQSGFVVTRHHMVLEGVCGDCEKQKG